MTPITLLVGFIIALLAAPLATAQSKEEQLREYVRENSIRLVDQLNEIRELYNSDREAFYEAMDDALGEFVAFRRVAARIMGKYARQASPEERDEFVRAFRRSLYDAYGGAAVSIDSSDFELEVDSVKINPRHEDRATVNLSIITNSGERYGVAYSMYEPDDGNWQVENVIVEGINMGLAFRDRFEQEMRAAEGNVSRVIDEWSADVGDIEGLEDAVDQQKGNG
ncbi:ABC transporter substrate-binding protein [Halomonas sp. 22501_18_FS]|uniref:ABC transporter substrate-binding protein n=1 Tax=Vreelandella halophila TaxID=86177 RepID=A0A9X5B383_9GAMM|nr:ABC transporter substrate-binding protein [Halomonas utahensis]MYL74747.1 ABC transporter substrate-binding protein [Halomonas sp. 22501_18_FS]